MKMRIALAVVLMVFGGVSNAQVNALPSLPHLLVKGQASRDVVPDRFIVSIALSTVDMKPEVAREGVQRNLGELLRSIKAAGALPDSVDATTFSVGPEYEYVESKRVFKGTRASRKLQATFPDAEKTRRFLATIESSEDVVLSGIEATYSGEAALRGELKSEAMQQTRETARLLAQSYGAQIKGLYSVSDVAPSFAYGIQAGNWPRGKRSIAEVPAPPGGSPVVLDTPRAVDVVSLSGNRITPESIAIGKITLAENLYAIFLLAD